MMTVRNVSSRDAFFDFLHVKTDKNNQRRIIFPPGQTSPRRKSAIHLKRTGPLGIGRLPPVDFLT
jgi:hypothetical protein